MELARVDAPTADLDAELLAAYPSLVRRLTLVLRDPSEAEDVGQAAFARAIERRARFHGGDARAWLYTIGLRLAFNELRRRKRRDGGSASLAATGSGAPGDPEWAITTDPDLWAALATIDAKARAALILSVLEGYTHAEIGRMLEVPAGTVSSWLSRTKASLRVALRDGGT